MRRTLGFGSALSLGWSRLDERGRYWDPRQRGDRRVRLGTASTGRRGRWVCDPAGSLVSCVRVPWLPQLPRRRRAWGLGCGGSGFHRHVSEPRYRPVPRRGTRPCRTPAPSSSRRPSRQPTQVILRTPASRCPIESGDRCAGTSVPRLVLLDESIDRVGCRGCAGFLAGALGVTLRGGHRLVPEQSHQGVNVDVTIGQ